MTEEEKRYKIKKIESYIADKKEFSKVEAKAFGVGTIALGMLFVGVKSMLELFNILPSDSIDLNYTSSIIFSLTGVSTAVELQSIATVINAIKNKIKLSGKIEEINEELDLFEEENNRSRGGR